jgi:hypothetical protein
VGDQSAIVDPDDGVADQREVPRLGVDGDAPAATTTGVVSSRDRRRAVPSGATATSASPAVPR